MCQRLTRCEHLDMGFWKIIGACLYLLAQPLFGDQFSKVSNLRPSPDYQSPPWSHALIAQTASRGVRGVDFV